MMVIREEGPNAKGNKIYTLSDQDTLEVPGKYQIQRVIGRGSYGLVCSAVNIDNGEMLAVKKIPRLFNDTVDGKRVLREVKALSFLDHTNVVGLRDVFLSGTPDTFTELYVVMELMETDLRRMLTSPSVRMGAGHCQYFTLQLLCALQYVHSAHIIHRDLKPGNLLVDSDCNLKLCDFGLSRGYYGGGPGEAPASVAGANGTGAAAGDGAAGNGSAGGPSGGADLPHNMTDYVVTRFYRPPELLLVCGTYDYSIDMWGAGCLVAEMITGKPLFPGRDYIHQLNLISELLGLPDVRRDLPRCTSTEAIQYIQSLPPVQRKSLAEYCPPLFSRFHDRSFLDSFEDGAPIPTPEDAFQLFEDFIFSLLRYRPESRLTAKQAVGHEWLATIRGGQTEIEGCEAAGCYSWEYDDKPVSVAQLRQMFVQEVNEFKASRRGES